MAIPYFSAMFIVLVLARRRRKKPGGVAAIVPVNPRPIIFPLSNPVRLSECEFHEAVEWSNGQAIFASGSPFPEQSFNGRTLYPGQGNNMYIFPGLGLGAIISRAAAVTDGMVAVSVPLFEKAHASWKF
ncbi:hypothetical protein EIP91_010761 [Steccherinum ochraceum]|uniref:Malic enzyme NAD-binding domain-containing protein n=1 Tax=Steccherinum ochraceum TaxID=92696 RepID=A0A4R0RCA2_9APHY|nr:hypothetical protein EIP91_010761 [Steccherinum ochraceum]